MYIKMSDWQSQKIVDFYTFQHLLVGICSFFITNSWANEEKTYHNEILFGFLVFFYTHTLWELLETFPFFINFLNDADKIITGKKRMQKYKGDSIVNTLSDSVAFVVGFWISYFLFKKQFT